jgi:membrane protein implicated in regulation of membrane protease activity
VTRKTVAVALSATAGCAAIYVTVVLDAHQHQPVYAMPITVVIVAGVCAALTAIGGLLSVRSGQVAPWLAPVATAIIMYGFLVAGTLILLPAIVLIVLLSRRTQSSRRREHDRLNAGAAVLLTLGLVPLGLLALWDQPVVECFPGGVSLAAPIWTSFQSTSGHSGASSSSSTPQQSSGAMTAGGVTYTFTCSGAHLVRFASG